MTTDAINTESPPTAFQPTWVTMARGADSPTRPNPWRVTDAEAVAIIAKAEQEVAVEKALAAAPAATLEDAANIIRDTLAAQGALVRGITILGTLGGRPLHINIHTDGA